MSNNIKLGLDLMACGVSDQGWPQYSVFVIPDSDGATTVSFDYSEFLLLMDKAERALSSVLLRINIDGDSYSIPANLGFGLTETHKKNWHCLFENDSFIIEPKPIGAEGLAAKTISPSVSTETMADLGKIGSTPPDRVLFNVMEEIANDSNTVASFNTYRAKAVDELNKFRKYIESNDEFYRSIDMSGSVQELDEERDPLEFSSILGSLIQHPKILAKAYGLVQTFSINPESMPYWRDGSWNKVELNVVLPTEYQADWQAADFKYTFTTFRKNKKLYHGPAGFGLMSSKSNDHLFTTIHPHRQLEEMRDFIDGSLRKLYYGNGAAALSKNIVPRSEGLFLLRKALSSNTQNEDPENLLLGYRVLASESILNNRVNHKKLLSLTSRRVEYQPTGECTWQEKDFDEEGWLQSEVLQETVDNQKLADPQLLFAWKGDNLGAQALAAERDQSDTKESGSAAVGVSPRVLEKGFCFKRKPPLFGNLWLRDGVRYGFLLEKIYINGYVMPLTSNENSHEMALADIPAKELDKSGFVMSGPFQYKEPINPPVIVAKQCFEDGTRKDNHGSSAHSIILREGRYSDLDDGIRFLFPPRLDTDSAKLLGLFHPQKIGSDLSLESYKRACMNLWEETQIKTVDCSRNAKYRWFPDIRARRLILVPDDWQTFNWMKANAIGEQLSVGESLWGIYLGDSSSSGSKESFEYLDNYPYIKYKRGWALVVKDSDNQRVTINRRKKRITLYCRPGSQLKFKLRFYVGTLRSNNNVLEPDDGPYSTYSNNISIYRLFGMWLDNPGTPAVELSVTHAAKKPHSLPRFINNSIKAQRLGEKGDTRIFYEFELDNLDWRCTRFVRVKYRFEEVDDTPGNQAAKNAQSSAACPLKSEFKGEDVFLTKTEGLIDEGTFRNDTGFKFTTDTNSPLKQLAPGSNILKFQYCAKHALNLKLESDAGGNVSMALYKDDEAISLALPWGHTCKITLNYFIQREQNGNTLDSPRLAVRVVFCTVNNVGDKEECSKEIVSDSYDAQEFGLPATDLSAEVLTLAEDIKFDFHLKELDFVNSQKYFVYSDLKSSRHRKLDIGLHLTGAFARYYPDVNDNNLSIIRVETDYMAQVNVPASTQPNVLKPQFHPMRASNTDKDKRIETRETQSQWLVTFERDQSETGDDWYVGIVEQVTRPVENADSVEVQASALGKDVTAKGSSYKKTGIMSYLNEDYNNNPWLQKYFPGGKPEIVEVKQGGLSYKIIPVRPHYLKSRDVWNFCLSLNLTKEVYDPLNGDDNNYNPFLKLTLVKYQQHAIDGCKLSPLSDIQFLPIYSNRLIEVKRARNGMDTQVRIKPDRVKVGNKGTSGSPFQSATVYALCFRSPKRGGLLGEIHSSRRVQSSSSDTRKYHFVVAEGNSVELNEEVLLKPALTVEEHLELNVYEFETFTPFGNDIENELGKEFDPLHDSRFRLVHAEAFDIEK